MSKIYIYESLDKVGTSYHDGGGAVIITDREPQKAWTDFFTKESKDLKYGKDDYLEIAEQELPEATQVIEYEDTEEKIHIFEDAGCC